MLARQGRPTISGLVVLLIGAAVVLSACGSSEERQAADQAEIQASLDAYLPLLGEAYSTGDVEILREWAAEKEMARIYKRVMDLAEQGRVLAPTLQRMTVEETKVWNYSNAFVTTLEVWDVRSLVIGTDQVVAEDLGQTNRVQYQLDRNPEGGEGRWRVLYRSKQD